MTDVLPSPGQPGKSRIPRLSFWGRGGAIPKEKKKRTSLVPSLRLSLTRPLPPNWHRLEVSKIATRGRVLSKRVQFLSGSKLFQGAIFCWGLFAGYHLVLNVMSPYMPELTELPQIRLSLNLDHRPPDFILNMAHTDASNYFDLGGGLKGDGRLDWMAEYRPRPEGLTVRNLNELVVAMKRDLPHFGTNSRSWESVGSLSFTPKVSRPEQAITKFSDRLPDGILIVLRDSSVVPFVGHSEGQWSVLLFKDEDCRAFVGPVPSGCEDRTKSGAVPNEARTILSMIDPKG
ncbi:hypothetical protein [Agrobacterium tumefaciens]|uniref:hypothetical protein n=1 Tax=Agrobacterium tumefaciens TaxID=358 RepID=UPI001571780D|nr:hypothetical protein [Agrobacterium tumefaciens]